MAKLLRAVRIGLWTVTGIGIVLILVLGGLTQTTVGKDFLLTQVLTRVEGAIAGRVQAERASSSGLLRGVTLHQVMISGEDGRTFVEADSIRAGYSVLGMIRGDIVLSRIAVYRPRVVVEREPGAAQYNAAAIFAPRDVADTLAAAVDTASPASRLIAFRNVEIHDGEVVVRLPRSGRDLRFTDIDIESPWIAIRDPERDGILIEISDAALTGDVAEDLFRVDGLTGELEITHGALHFPFSQLRLPGSRGAGDVAVTWSEEEETRVDFRIEASRLSTRDFHWLEARIPSGVGTGVVEVTWTPGVIQLRFDGLDLDLSGGRLSGGGRIVLGDRIAFRDLDVVGEGLDVALLSPWLPQEPPPGLIDGWATADGPLEALSVEAQLTLRDPQGMLPPTFVDAIGALHLGERLGVSDFDVRLDPFSYGWATRVVPELGLTGPGAVSLQASGYIDSGVMFIADLSHRPVDLPQSRVRANGSVRQDSLGVWLDVDSELLPLSFTALQAYHGDLPLSGEMSGTVRAWGPLEELELVIDLDTPAGAFAVDARLDVTDPGAAYRIEGTVRDFRLSRVLPKLPEPTLASGSLSIRGRGIDLETIQGEARLNLTHGRVGSVSVDSARVHLRAVDGVLHVDTLVASTSAGSVIAEGSLGLREGSEAGEVLVSLASESLTDIGAFFLGESPIAVDTLSPLERRALTISGVNLDTLRTSEATHVGGALDGSVTLRGWVNDFSAEGTLRLENGVLMTDRIAGLDVTFTAEGLPGLGGAIHADIAASGVRIRERELQGVQVDLDYSRTGGRLNALLERDESEEYRVRATAVWDSAGGTVNLDELTLRLDSVRWNLGGPATMSWSEGGYVFRDFRLIRPGFGEMRVEANGALPRRGSANFTLDVHRLDLDRLSHVAQLREPLTGELDLEVHVVGDASNPVVTGALSGRNLSYAEYHLDLVEGEIDYWERRIRTRLEARLSGRQVFNLSGFLPADFSLERMSAFIPEEPLELTLLVDSLPISLPLAPLRFLEEVEGSISGQVRFGGTPRDIEPTGRLQLDGGAATIPALGIRHTGVEATLDLFSNGAVDIDGRIQSGEEGAAQVKGVLDLNPLTDPRFELTITAQDFQAARRRDVEGRVSGEVQLEGRYRRPFVEGGLRVEEGVMFVEEFARTALVVDLSDPAFFDVVDTALVALRSALSESENPFLQNLRMNVNLEVGRNTWLRSRDMNVDIGGNLLVTWDRTSRDLAMVGELEAIRGRYSVFGRQFQVQSGTVAFLGTPGLNPNLEIEALNRLRTPYLDEPLSIFADVTGTLLAPRVGLRSDFSLPVAESDLVSYLIFGRPSYALATGQSAIVEGAAGALLGAATGAGMTLGLGVLSSQLGSVVARDIGIDYFAINQGLDVSPFTGGSVRGSLAESAAWTEVELGQYVRDDVFVAIQLRPLYRVGSSTARPRGPLAGVRMEWTLGDLWTVEGFLEDRFSRNRHPGFANLALDTELVAGFFVYQEWGY